MIVRQRGSFAFVMDALRGVAQQSCPIRMQVAFSIADHSPSSEQIHVCAAADRKCGP
jgi:hypothetical protein